MKAFLSLIVAAITALSCLITTPRLQEEFRNKGDISSYSETMPSKKQLDCFETDENGDFTILAVADTHLTSCIFLGDLRLVEKIKREVISLKPHLVVLLGDIINDGDSGIFNKAYCLRTLAEMFEELNQPWAYVPGNNDGRNYGTTEDVTAFLCQYEHCMISDEKDISGATQFSLDIYDDTELTHSLIFMDTMDYDNEDPDHIYGYVREDQVLWAKREISSKQEKSSDVTVSVFMHENTPAFRLAAQNGEAYKKGYATIKEQAEKYDIPKNKPLDDVFAESGCVGLVSIGHVHPLTAQCSFYENTYYHISPQCTKADILITIHTNENSIREMYDFEIIR